MRQARTLDECLRARGIQFTREGKTLRLTGPDGKPLGDYTNVKVISALCDGTFDRMGYPDAHLGVFGKGRTL